MGSKVLDCLTLPFSPEDMLKILASFEPYARSTGRATYNASSIRSYATL